MKMNRTSRSLLLAGALLVSLASPALASWITKTELYFAGADADKMGQAITENPERMFGLGSVRNRVVSEVSSRTVQEFDTTAFAAAGVFSAHVKMTSIDRPRICSFGGFNCKPDGYDIVVELSNGAKGTVTHTFNKDSAVPVSYWTNDYSQLESTKGRLATEVLRKVHNDVVIPNVTLTAVTAR